MPPVLPGEGHTVPIGQGVADGVVGDGLPVVGGQQVPPRVVLVGVGVADPIFYSGQNTPAVIVSVIY